MAIEDVKDYKYILHKFGKDVVAGRCDWVKNAIEEYLFQESLNERAYVSESILFHVIIDYYVDIDRLKEFQDIETTNTIKIYSYLIFWILRHKPIQIDQKTDESIAFLNEDFCAEFLRSFLFDNPANVPIREEKAEVINDFLDTLLYYFKYRDYSAKSIEMMIIAFEAGRGYQFSVDHPI